MQLRVVILITGELLDIERVTSSSAGACWKSGAIFRTQLVGLLPDGQAWFGGGTLEKQVKLLAGVLPYCQVRFGRGSGVGDRPTDLNLYRRLQY